MTRLAVLPIVVAAVLLAAVAVPAAAQAAFKVPYKFESGGKKLAAGDYVVTKTGASALTFRHVATGKETLLPFTDALEPAEPPVAEPRIVFDEVGNFEPSYTEYFTVYVVAEVWLSAKEGYLVHTTKGGHKTQVVKGEAAKK